MKGRRTWNEDTGKRRRNTRRKGTNKIVRIWKNYEEERRSKEQEERERGDRRVVKKENNEKENEGCR